MHYENESGKPGVWVLLEINRSACRDESYPLVCVATSAEIALTNFVDEHIGPELFKKISWQISPSNFGFWEGEYEDGTLKYFLVRMPLLHEEVLQAREEEQQQEVLRVHAKINAMETTEEDS